MCNDEDNNLRAVCLVRAIVEVLSRVFVDGNVGGGDEVVVVGCG